MASKVAITETDRRTRQHNLRWSQFSLISQQESTTTLLSFHLISQPINLISPTNVLLLLETSEKGKEVGFVRNEQSQFQTFKKRMTET